MTKRVWIGVAAVAFLMFSFESALILTGKRILIHQDLVQPGTNYIVPDYGNLKKNGQASLVCRYFTGRRINNDVLWYSPNNAMGKDECPFFSQQEEKPSGLDLGSLADWVSGIATTLATIVALGSYSWADNRRKKEDKQRRQDSAYQIGFKLASLMSDAISNNKAMYPAGTTHDDWKGKTNPFEIVGPQQPIIGTGAIMARDLTDAEQNLLMSIKEEDFLQDMTECYARNEAIREGINEYKDRHALLTERLPAPSHAQGQVASLYLTDLQVNELFPYAQPAATLIQNLRSMSQENLKMLRELGPKFHPMMNKHWPDLHLHKIEEVTGTVQAA